MRIGHQRREVYKMAAVMRVNSGNVRFLAMRVPSVICRVMSNASTVGGGDAKTPTTPSSSPAAANEQDAADNSTYKVQEYYSYNEYSFYDLENVIDSSGRRQIQPDPKVKYQHTDPWSTQEKSTT